LPAPNPSHASTRWNACCGSQRCWRGPRSSAELATRDRDLRSISCVRSVPIAPSTEAPPADAGPVRRGPTAAPAIRKGFSRRAQKVRSSQRSSDAPAAYRRFTGTGCDRDHAAAEARSSGTLPPVRPAMQAPRSADAAASVPSVSSVRERPAARRRRPSSSRPGRRTGDPDLTTKSTKVTKKQSIRRGDRQVGSPFETARSRGLGVRARGTGLRAPASRRLGLRALRALRGESCLDGAASCEDLAQGFGRALY
jgi:hypothetical protein